MSDTVKIEGYSELMRALNKYDRELKSQLRSELKAIAGIVQAKAEDHAQANISRIGPKWSRMRIGVTSSVVYVAPRQKGTKTRKRKRKNLGYLLMHKALEPALDESTPEIRAALEAMLDRIGHEAGF